MRTRSVVKHWKRGGLLRPAAPTRRAMETSFCNQHTELKQFLKHFASDLNPQQCQFPSEPLVQHVRQFLIAPVLYPGRVGLHAPVGLFVREAIHAVAAGLRLVHFGGQGVVHAADWDGRQRTARR